MAAFPFGGYPTFAQYIDWAISRGCKVQVGVDTQRSIGVTKIISPDGEKWVNRRRSNKIGCCYPICYRRGLRAHR